MASKCSALKPTPTLVGESAPAPATVATFPLPAMVDAGVFAARSDHVTPGSALDRFARKKNRSGL